MKTKEEKLLERDGGRCQCCSKKLNLYNMTIGHRISKAISKTNQLPNLQLECESCNRDKNKFNKQYIRNARSFINNGGKLEVFVHPTTYKRIEKEGNLDWFEKNRYILKQNKNVMIGDFVIY